jgi:hypothetical protein
MSQIVERLKAEGYTPIQLTEEHIGIRIAIIINNKIVAVGFFKDFHPGSWNTIVDISKGSNDLPDNYKSIKITQPQATIFLWDDILHDIIEKEFN